MNSRSVLVIDPNPEVLALITAILEGPKVSGSPRSNLRVLRARNLTEAADVLSREYVPVNLVLSSAELLEQVRNIRPHVPMLQMSAVTNSETIQVHTDDRGLFRAVVAAIGPAPAAVRTAVN